MELRIDNVAMVSDYEISQLRKAFDFVCRKLDLVETKGVVSLKYLSLTTEEGAFHLIMEGASGGTHDTINDGVIEMYIIKAPGEDDPIKIFMHEMVHAADTFHGVLVSEGEAGSCWYNKFYSYNLPHDRRPWEAKAIAMAPQLYEEFLNEQSDRAA